MASKKIKDFYNGRFFRIPRYQRGYAWDIQNIRDLFDDIIESIETNSNHYIGTIVLSKSKDDEDMYYVVDGQQRITTLTLLVNILVKKLPDQDAKYYERFYIKEGNRYRLTPLNRDKDYFVGLIDGNVGEPENKSQRFMKEAASEISYKVETISDKLGFLRYIEKLELMEFVEDSEGDAIRIFQTVNDRGKPLSNIEKAKSLLIYFSNRYLEKKLDDAINVCFSDIFEIYDDIKHIGEELGISLISNKDFNEDSLMRYHFVTFSNENYDATAQYVLQFLKNKLADLRSNKKEDNYKEIEDFITSYSESLKDFFFRCRNLIIKAKTEVKYYKIFVVLNLSATLYPLIVKLEMLNLLEARLTGENAGRDLSNQTFLDLVELIDVRVYKTRGTDPKADISRLTFEIDTKNVRDVEDWLIWFNKRWMSREEFQSSLHADIYGNRALTHIFIDYCESLMGDGHKYTIDEIRRFVSLSPTIEHILSQTPSFAPKALNFRSKEDFIDYEHTIGNLTILEKKLNSRANNLSAAQKVAVYADSIFEMTKLLGSEIHSSRKFGKNELQARTQVIADYCLDRWWC